MSHWSGRTSSMSHESDGGGDALSSSGGGLGDSIARESDNILFAMDDIGGPAPDSATGDELAPLSSTSSSGSGGGMSLSFFARPAVVCFVRWSVCFAVLLLRLVVLARASLRACAAALCPLGVAVFCCSRFSLSIVVWAARVSRLARCCCCAARGRAWLAKRSLRPAAAVFVFGSLNCYPISPPPMCGVGALLVFACPCRTPRCAVLLTRAPLALPAREHRRRRRGER